MMPSQPDSGLAHPESEHGHQYCWEHNGNGEVREGCLQCSVYLMRAQRCYELARLGIEAGHAGVYCKESCEDCDYYRQVQGQGINVLVVTDDPDMTAMLRATADESSFDLQITDCEYNCSALINHFRPDFAVIDCSLGLETSRDISSHLIQDPRIPFVRLVLAGSEEEFPGECEKEVFARIHRPFTLEDIVECIKGIGSQSENHAPILG